MLICAIVTATWQIAASPEPVPLRSHDDDQTTVLSAVRSISGARMLMDIRILSGDEFAGRQAGSDGDLKAADLVSQRFSSLHMITSAPFQARSHEEPEAAMPVPVYSIQDNAHLELATPSGSTPGRTPTDFLPILDSPSVNLTAPVVFVGYGIADAARGYEEYAGLDVQDKIVMFLRGKPEHYPVMVTHAEKERAARARGAAAFLTVTGPIMNQYEVRRGMTVDPSAFYGGRDGATPLAGAWISPGLADRILAADAQTLQGLQENLSRTRRPQSILTSSTVHMVWGATESVGKLRNVVAAIPGRNPEGKNETILLGAHRDHFGRQAGLLFPGADDNASGTAVILEVARAIMEAGLSPKRTIIFASFSGEEQGMLGSRFYLSGQVHETGNLKTMINVDHAGIGNGRLTVGLSGLEKNVAMEAGERAGVADRLDLFGFFPGGDHVPFKEAGVPTVTVVSGGPHPHFHKTTDTVETIDPEILQITARYVLAVTWQLANQP